MWLNTLFLLSFEFDIHVLKVFGYSVVFSSFFGTGDNVVGNRFRSFPALLDHLVYNVIVLSITPIRVLLCDPI